MIDGANDRDPAGRGRDRGGGERGPASGQPLIGLARDLDQTYPGGEWLRPAFEALGGGFELLDRARLVLVVSVGAVALLYVGAKLEREIQRRQLRVLDGVEETDGDRS